MKLELGGYVNVRILITQKDHPRINEEVIVNVELNELIGEGLSQIVVDDGTFEYLGHPCDSYDVLSIETVD